MKLCVISHTEHYRSNEGQILGWGPTVNEINHLTEVFDEIYHVAMLHDDIPPKSALPYTSSKIKFIELPVLGGKTIGHKLNIIWNAPKTIRIVKKTLPKVDYFQLRAPTGIGVFLISYLTLFNRKKGWYKYAGNWKQVNPPLGYWFQRTILKLQKRKVTINGRWPKQKSQCITFENPCLTEVDLEKGKQIAIEKVLTSKINFCYVGRLERPKGVERIIKGFMDLSEKYKAKVGIVHLVGDGVEKDEFIKMSKNSRLDIRFHGFLERKDVFKIYKQSHFFLMPTNASEGFPKVIAEAYNFGCIPIVSSISAIGHYIKHDKNGLIINPVTVDGFKIQLKEALMMDGDRYKMMLTKRNTFVEDFSYSHYNHRIVNEIIKNM